MNIRRLVFMGWVLLITWFLVGCRSSAPGLSPVPNLEPTPVAQPGVASWTTSKVAVSVGDVIRVVVDEFTLAQANTENRATNARNNSIASSLAAALKGNSLGDASLSVGSQKSRDASRAGNATRSNRFSSEVSVRVLGFSKTGQVYVRGQRFVLLDNHEQRIQLSGWIRPQDVSAQNVVLSSRIADAELVYAGNGSLDDAPAGLLSRILSALTP